MSRALDRAGFKIMASGMLSARKLTAVATPVDSFLRCAVHTCTGWARSISMDRHSPLPLPQPAKHRLAFFVREPFPASGSQVSVREGSLDEAGRISVWSEMESGGASFADGVEADALPFG